MGKGPPQPVDCPDHHHIELSTGSAFPERIKGWSLVATFGATDALVDELLDNLPPIPLGHEAKLTKLVLGRLPIGAHPRVNRDSLSLVIVHCPPPFPLHMFST